MCHPGAEGHGHRSAREPSKARFCRIGPYGYLVASMLPHTMRLQLLGVFTMHASMADIGMPHAADKLRGSRCLYRRVPVPGSMAAARADKGALSQHRKYDNSSAGGSLLSVCICSFMSYRWQYKVGCQRDSIRRKPHSTDCLAPLRHDSSGRTAPR